MPEPNQPPINSFDRPSARLAATPAPVQRGNYGIPPRQSTPQPPSAPTTPRFMDVSAPPARPSQPLTPQAVTPTPAPAPVVQSQPEPASPLTPVSPAPVQPLFTSAPSVKPAGRSERKVRHWTPKVQLAVMIIAGFLVIGGLARWVTAGNTNNDVIAVAAVAANDGRTMTIQFTADDGKMHKFTSKSQAKLIPGTAVQVAYRSGAPDASVRQVAIVQKAHNTGVILFVVGLLLFAVSGIVYYVKHLLVKRKQSAPPLTTPVTV